MTFRPVHSTAVDPLALSSPVSTATSTCDSANTACVPFSTAVVMRGTRADSTREKAPNLTVAFPLKFTHSLYLFENQSKMARMKLYTLADITIAATGVKQPVLSPGHQLCSWYQVQGNTVSSVVRVGDENVTANRGAIVTSGGAQFSPPISQNAANAYDLADVFVVGTIGDVLAVNYAQ